MLAFLSFGVAHAQTYESHFPEVTLLENNWGPYVCFIVDENDTVFLTNTSIEVAAYCGDEIRGKVFIGSGYSTNRPYSHPIMIQGNQNEVITFKIYDHATGKGDDYECLTTTAINVDVTYLPSQPLVIHFKSNEEEEEEDEIPYPWTVEQGSGGDNAQGTFQVQINGVNVSEDIYTLGIFNSEDVCRGYQENWMLFPLTSAYLHTFTFFGDDGEEDHFLLYNRNEECYVGSCDVTITFTKNETYGSAPQPMILNFVIPFIFDGSDNDHNWSTIDNWRYKALPTATDEVTINGYCEMDQDVAVKNIIVNEEKTLKVLGGKTLTLTEGIVTTDASQLVLVDNAQLIDASQTAALASYMITVEGYESNENNWYIFGSPMSDNVSIANTDFPTGEYDLYWYDETNLTHEEWRNYKANQDGEFIPGMGYLYANKVNCTPSLAGTLNYGNVSVNMTYTDRPYDDLEGLNLFANPYPYTITIDNFANSSLTDGYYRMVNGDWDPQTSSTPIETGQAFLIGCTAPNTVTFQPNATTKGERSNRNVIKVNIANSEYADHAFIILNEGNDLVKIAHRNTSAPEVYIPVQNKAYAIAHFNNVETAPVAYRPTLFGQQTLSVELEGSYEYLTLKDNLTGTEVNLLNTPTYKFNANPSDMVNRFTLNFKANTNVNDVEVVNPINYRNDGQLTINGVQGESELQVIDMLGRIVSSTTINGEYTQMLHNTPGVYVIRLVTANNTYTQKIVVE